MDDIRIKTVPVGMLGTCCYLLWREGRADCAVVDPGAEPERIRDAAEGRRITDILLTHGHFDHIGGVAALKAEGARLIVHRLDAPLLSDPQRNASWMIRAAVTAPMADTLVRDGDRLTCAGIDFTVLHTPGHTPGSVCYQTEAGLFTGDTMFHTGWGRTDLPGGSEAELQRSLARVRPLAQTMTIYPGHEA